MRQIDWFMQIKPRIVKSRIFKDWVCISKAGIGIGYSPEQAYNAWKRIVGTF